MSLFHLCRMVIELERRTGLYSGGVLVDGLSPVLAISAATLT
jgi:hypothetical protein